MCLPWMCVILTIRSEPDNSAVYEALSKLRLVVDSSPELQEAKDEYNRLVCSLSKPSDLDWNVRNGLYEMLTGKSKPACGNGVHESNTDKPRRDSKNQQIIGVCPEIPPRICAVHSRGNNSNCPDQQSVLRSQNNGTDIQTTLTRQQVCLRKPNIALNEQKIASSSSQQQTPTNIPGTGDSKRFTIQVPKQTLDLWKVGALGNNNGIQITKNQSAAKNCDAQGRNSTDEYTDAPDVPKKSGPPNLKAQSTNQAVYSLKIPLACPLEINSMSEPFSRNNGRAEQYPVKRQGVNEHKLESNSQVLMGGVANQDKGALIQKLTRTASATNNQRVESKSSVIMSFAPNQGYNEPIRSTGPFLPPPAIYYIQPPTSTVTQTVQLPPQTINHTFIPRMRSVSPIPQPPPLNIGDIKKAFKDLICNIPHPKPIVLREKPNTVVVTQTISQPAVTVTNTNIDAMLSKQQIELTKIFSQIARLYDLIRKGLRFSNPASKIPVKLMRPIQQQTHPMDIVLQTKTILKTLVSANPSHQKSCVCPIVDTKIHPDRTGCYDIYTNGCHCILCYPGHTETKYKTRTVVKVDKNGSSGTTTHKESQNIQTITQTSNSLLKESDGYRYQTTFPPEFSDYTPLSVRTHTSTSTQSSMISSKEALDSTQMTKTGKICKDIEAKSNIYPPQNSTSCYMSTINGIECKICYPGTTSTNFKTRTVVGKRKDQINRETTIQNSICTEVSLKDIETQQTTCDIENNSKSLADSEHVSGVSTLRKTRTVVRGGDCGQHQTEGSRDTSQSCKTKIIDATTYIECKPTPPETSSVQKYLSRRITSDTKSIYEAQSCFTNFDNGTTHIFCVPSTMIPQKTPQNTRNGGENTEIETLCSKILENGDCGRFDDSDVGDDVSSDNARVKNESPISEDSMIAKTVSSQSLLDNNHENSDNNVAVVFLDRRDMSDRLRRPLMHDTKNNVLIDDNVLLHLDSLSEIFPAVDESDSLSISSNIPKRHRTKRNSSSELFSQIHDNSTVPYESVFADATKINVSSTVKKDLSDVNEQSEAISDSERTKTNISAPSSFVISSQKIVSHEQGLSTNDRSFEYSLRSNADQFTCTDTDCYNYRANTDTLRTNNSSHRSQEGQNYTQAFDSKNSVHISSKNPLAPNRVVTTTCNSVGCYEIEVLTRTLPFPTITNTSSTNTKCDITKIITLDEIDYENGSTIIETITDLDLDDLFDKIETETTTSYYIEGGNDIEVINENIGERIFSPTVKKGALVKTGNNEFKYIERTDSSITKNGQKRDKLYISDLPIFHDQGHPIRKGHDLTSKTIIKKGDTQGEGSKCPNQNHQKDNKASNSSRENGTKNRLVVRKTQGEMDQDCTITDSRGNSIYSDPENTFEECGQENQNDGDDEYVLLSDIFSDRYQPT